MHIAATHTIGRHLALTNPWIISLLLPEIQHNIMRYNTIEGAGMIPLMSLLTVDPAVFACVPALRILRACHTAQY